MKVGDVEGANGPPQRYAQGRRPIEATEVAAREIRNLHAIDVHDLPDRHRALPVAIDIGRVDVDVVPVRGEFPGQRVDRTDGPP